MHDIIDSGINFGYDKDNFYVDYISCGNDVGNYREEFRKRARELSIRSNKLMLSLSSGLDSQAVLHSFIEQNLEIQCAFLYQPTFNEIEYSQLQQLIKKYKINPIIVELNPIDIKEEILEQYDKTKIPPNQLIHKKFLEKLPKNYDFIQGTHGTDIFYRDDTWYCLDCANSFEISRLRALNDISREGRVIGWERDSRITLSFLTDEVVTSFMYAYSYISSDFLTNTGKEIRSVIDHWDSYIKPFLYGKYWKDELEYFPKYQGCEGIDYIMFGPKQDYRSNRVILKYNTLVNHLKNSKGLTKRVYEFKNK